MKKKKNRIIGILVCISMLFLSSGLTAATVGATIEALKDYDYLAENGKLIINKYNGNDTSIRLNSSYKSGASEYQLSEIGEYAFENAKITDVYLPNGLTALREGAFYNCDSLGAAAVPKTVKELDAYTFDDCNNLKKVTVYSPDCKIGDSAIGYYAVTTGTGRNQKTEYRRITDLLIIGYSGSTAEKYANSNGFAFSNIVNYFEKGDANCDGTIDIRDLIYIKKAASGIIDSNIWCDLNSDNKTDSTDLALSKKKTVFGSETLKEYTVIFKNYDGTVLKTEKVKEGKSATPPEAPLRNDYSFAGWDTPFGKITGDAVVNATFKANNSPAFKVSRTESTSGSEDIAVTVSLVNNPGISSIGMKVSFDSALTLTAVEYNDKMGGQAMAPSVLSSPIKLTWVSPFENVNGDMVFATLHFKAASSAVGELPVKISYNADDVYDMSENNIEFDIIDGAVIITNPSAVTKPTFAVSSTSCSPGEENVAVTVSIVNNPGISSIGMKISFDKALTLTDVKYNSEMGGQSMAPATFSSPAKLTWVSPFANSEGDRVFATLYFKVADDASGNLPIGISYNTDDIYDMTENNIAFDVINGAIIAVK